MPTRNINANQFLEELEKKRQTVKPSKDNEVFEKIFGHLGGTGPLVAEEDMLHEVRDDLNKLDQNAHFDFIKSNLKTALVAEQNDKAYIGMTTGFSWLIMRLFGVLLSGPQLFPEIGNADALSEEGFRFQVEFFRDQPFATIFALPACKKRTDLIFGLISCAHTYIYFHEFSHFHLRHLEYLSSRSSFSILDESTFDDEIGSSSELLQIMELEADRMAILTSLRYWRSIPESRHFDESFGITPDNVWLLALESVMVLFEHLSKTNGLIEGLTHPPSLDRWGQLKLLAHDMAEESGLENIKITKQNLSFAQVVNDFLSDNELSGVTADYSPDTMIQTWKESLPKPPEVVNRYHAEIGKLQKRYWARIGVSPPDHWERVYSEKF